VFLSNFLTNAPITASFEPRVANFSDSSANSVKSHSSISPTVSEINLSFFIFRISSTFGRSSLFSLAFVVLSIRNIFLFSTLVTKVIAVPFFHALPVLPILCVYVSGLSGKA